MLCLNINTDDETGVKSYKIISELPEIFEQRLSNFLQEYDIQNVISDDKEFHQEYIPAKERVCMFCGLSYPDTQFTGKSHLIPQCLGNKKLLSFRECDECNNHFGKFENDIINYVGFKRLSFSSKKVKFTPPGKKFTLSGRINIDNVNRKLKAIYEEENPNCQLPFKTHSYSLLNLWKIIVKMALSAMPQEDLNDYEGLINYLFQDCGYMHETHYKEIYSVFIHKIHGPINKPLGILFKKKDTNTDSFTHTFQLYFSDEVWQVFLPMNLKDNSLYNGKTRIIYRYCPPIVVDKLTFEDHNKRPTLEHIFANRKAKTYRIQNIKIPVSIIKRIPEKDISIYTEVRKIKGISILARGVFIAPPSNPL